MPRAFPMGHRHRGAGLNSSGLQDIERAVILSRHFGQTWYVDSGVAGGVSGSGDSWGSAFTTLQAAINAAIANDVIFISPRHAENISAAGSVTCNKAGVRIIGVGVGRNRPVFTWTATAGTWLVSSASVWIENCVFVGTGIDAVVTMMGITGDDCTFVGCEWDFAISGAVCLLGITVTGVNRFRFYNNSCHGTANANCTNFIQIVGSAGKQKDFEIVGNSIIGNFTTTLGCINNITVACVNIIIADNVFVNGTTSATKVVVLLTGSTGLIMKNTDGIGTGTAPFTGDATWWAGNWSAAAVATAGTLT